MPHTVSLGAQKNFLAFARWVGEQWTQSDADFNDEFFRNAVAKAIVFRHTERMVTRQPWYQHGYRANIVAYTVAFLTSLIRSKAPGMTVDLRRVWAGQGVSPNLDSQLALIAKAAFDVIVSPSLGVQNVTEWCKKEICWQHVGESDVRLTKAFVQELVDEGEMQAAKKDARVQRKVHSGIEAQTTVVNLGSTYWLRLGAWGKQNKLLSGEDEKLLRVAAKIPRTIPEDWQSVALLEIMRCMEEEGFQVP
ncbi:MAG: AIPR family protein, partial [Pyrinomonadaceae bacterium]